MTFEYRFVDVLRRYALGVDHATKTHFLSFIFQTYKCDFEEFYVITPNQFLEFQTDTGTALRFSAAMQVARTCEFGEPEAMLMNAGFNEPKSMAPAHSIEIDELVKTLRRQHRN